MNKDYVHNSRPARKRKPVGRSGASKPIQAPFPVFRAALALALVIGFGVFLYFIKGTAGTPADSAKAKPIAKPVPIEEQRPSKEKFDYMTLLENKEVNVDLPSGASPTDLSIDPEQQKRMQALQQQAEAQRLKAQQESDGEHPLGSPTAQTGTTATQPGTPAGTTTATGTGTATKPKLSESERAAALLAGQIVPFSSLEDSKSSKPQAAVENKPKGTVENRPGSATSTSSTPNRGYLMQCGAFRSAEQAESMKLRLSMQGSGTQIQRGNTASGTWYKVLLGPFASRAEAERQLSHLQSKRIVEHCTIWMK